VTFYSQVQNRQAQAELGVARSGPFMQANVVAASGESTEQDSCCVFNLRWYCKLVKTPAHKEDEDEDDEDEEEEEKEDDEDEEDEEYDEDEDDEDEEEEKEDGERAHFAWDLVACWSLSRDISFYVTAQCDVPQTAEQICFLIQDQLAIDAQSMQLFESSSALPRHVEIPWRTEMTLKIVMKDGAPESIRAQQAKGAMEWQRLLQRVNHADVRDGRSPAHYAVADESHADVLRSLKELDADLNRRGRSGRSPAHYAAGKNHADALRTLKELGVDLNCTDRFGMSPAHRAAEENHADALRTLKELGADMNCTDGFGMSPAHMAAEKNHADALRTLKELDADLNCTDPRCMSPAYHARANNHADALRTLKELGADMN